MILDALLEYSRELLVTRAIARSLLKNLIKIDAPNVT